MKSLVERIEKHTVQETYLGEEACVDDVASHETSEKADEDGGPKGSHLVSSLDTRGAVLFSVDKVFSVAGLVLVEHSRNPFF